MPAGEDARGPQAEAGTTSAAPEQVAPLAAFLEVALVLLLRAGHAEVQAATAPAVPGDVALLHHLLGLAAASASYCLVGYVIAYGRDQHKVGSAWYPSTHLEWQEAAHGWCLASVSTSVLSAAASGRLHLAAHAAVAAVHAGVSLPLAARWTHGGWLARASFKDLGGGVLAHASGGALALVATLFLGRRLVLPSELETSWRVRPPSSAVLGHALVAVGAASLCLSAPGAVAAAVNSALAGAGAVLAELLLMTLVHDEWRQYWSLMATLQASVAGVVIVSSGADDYIPAVALLVGALGGAVSCELSRLLHRTVLEDPAGAVSAHLACGVMAGLLPPLAGRAAAAAPDWVWQVAGLAAVLAVTLAAALPVMAALACAGLLRSLPEDRQHRRPRVRAAFFRRLYPPREIIVPGRHYHDDV